MKPHKTIAKGLDDRAAKIRSELDNATALRKEAEAKLADAERRQSEAEASAKEIVETARREAAQFAADASAALTERIKLREKLAEERIARAESEAVRDVRMAAVETASQSRRRRSSPKRSSARPPTITSPPSLEKVTKALS